MPIRILVADDHATFRQKLKALLKREGFAVVGEASDGQEAVKLARELHPDVALLDFAMPVLNGVDAARKMLRASPGTKTILLTVRGETHYILEAFRAGMSGYVLKRRLSEELPQAIHAVSEGRTYLCAGASHILVQALLDRTKPPEAH